MRKIPPDDEGTHRVFRAAGGAERACLLVISRDGIATHLLPPRGEITVGRAQDCDVRVQDPSVSRQHARIALGPPARVSDLGSANGVYVRGARVAPGEHAVIAPGESVEIGEVVLVLQQGAGHLRGAGGAGHRVPPVARPASTPGPTVVADDPATQRVFELVRRVGPSAISVLLLGETGVGKEIVAAALHAASPRAAGPFVGINCGALSPALLESELFGHEKGAFTGADAAKPGLLESADGGTVFLDEVGDLPLALQVKLLRVLEERRVQRVGSLKPRALDVRFVAATNRDLKTDAETGAFRRDLYFRLNGLSLTIPPLRARRGDLPSLLALFAARAAAAAGRSPPRFSDAARAALERYPWPGNVRELRNAIERAVVLCADGEITPACLPEEITAGSVPPPAHAAADPPRGAPLGTESLRTEVDATERRQILAALERCQGNQTRAAALLGISRRTLINRLDAFGLPRPRKAQ